MLVVELTYILDYRILLEFILNMVVLEHLLTLLQMVQNKGLCIYILLIMESRDKKD